MKPGLGRGLGALIGGGMTSAAVADSPKEEIAIASDRAGGGSGFDLAGTSPAADALDKSGLSLKTVAIDLIDANPEQPRQYFSAEDLADLASSIIEHGVLQPLIVTRKSNGRFELVAGERRLRASKMAKLSEVPVVIRGEETDKDKLVLALLENIQRADLNPIEEARSYARLSDEYGLTHDEIAKKVGKSRSAISNALRLLELDEDILLAVEMEKISRSHAKTLLSENDQTKRRAMFEAMMSGKMTVRAAEAKIETKQTRKRRVVREKDPVLLALESRLRQSLETKVAVDDRSGMGTVTIHYYSPDDLRRLVAKLEVKEED